MSTTLHITAKLKPDTVGMRVSGTLVAVNAAGITYPQYYGSPPQSSTSGAVTMLVDKQEGMDTIAISGTVGFSPLQAGQRSDLIDAPSSASAIWITTMGAVSSSTATDALSAIRAAISAAALTSHKTVFVPAGDFAHSGTITASAVSIVGQGPTSILRGTNWTTRSIWLKGSSAGIKNVTLLTNGVGTRQAPWEYVGIVLNGAINFTVENCKVKHNGAAGLQTIASAGPGTITRCTFSGTLADSIHMTDEAHHITVTLNRIIASGDDGVACVSYSYDGGRVKNIEAAYNWISGNLGGRGMSVVGGQDINYHNNLITDNSQWAGIYIAQENSYQSFACQSVSCTFNTIQNCGSNVTGHPGLLVFSDGTYTNSSIAVVRNHIVQTGTENGIQYFGPQVGVTFTQNVLSATAGDYIGGVTAGVTVTLYSSGNYGYPYTTA